MDLRIELVLDSFFISERKWVFQVNVRQIGFMYSCLPIEEKPGYYELIISKAKEEDRFE